MPSLRGGEFEGKMPSFRGGQFEGKMPSFRGGQFEGKMPLLQGNARSEGILPSNQALGYSFVRDANYLRKVMRPLLKS